MKISGKEKRILVVLGLIVVCVLLYQFVYLKISGLREGVQAELQNQQENLQKQKQKADTLESLKTELKNTSDNYAQRVKKYYGLVPQETFLFLLHDWRVTTGLEFSNISFSKPEIIGIESIGSQAQSIVEFIDSSGVKPIRDSVGKMDGEIATTDLMRYKINLTLKGKYAQIKRFLNLVDNNKGNISINSFSITPENPITYYPVIAPKDALVGNATQSDIAYFGQRQAEQEEDVWNVTLAMEILTIPGKDAIPGKESTDVKGEDTEKDDAKAEEKETVAKNPWDWRWEWVASSDKFDEYLNFLAKERIKTSLYDFKDNSYKLSDTATATVEKEEENSYLNVEYEFKKDAKNPKVTIDLTDKKISIPSKVDGMGMRLYSSGMDVYTPYISYNKVTIKLQDANKKMYDVDITDKIYWLGWATLSKNLDPAMKYPVTVKSIEVSKKTDKLGEAIKGILRFDFIYTETIKK